MQRGGGGGGGIPGSKLSKDYFILLSTYIDLTSNIKQQYLSLTINTYKNDEQKTVNK